ncbi:hypothetical protein GCM10027290_66510 [Micromonospora sonneratiae]
MLVAVGCPWSRFRRDDDPEPLTAQLAGAPMWIDRPSFTVPHHVPADLRRIDPLVKHCAFRSYDDETPGVGGELGRG